MSAFRFHRALVSRLLLGGGLICATAGVGLAIRAAVVSDDGSAAPGATAISVALALVTLGIVFRPNGTKDARGTRKG